jgi:hypothetical protein
MYTARAAVCAVCGLLPLETGYGENAGHAEKNALLMYRLQSIEF